MSDTTFAHTFPSDRLQATAANNPRRTTHGSGGWTLPSRFGVLRQPQDGALTGNAVTGSSLRTINGRPYSTMVEAEDARLSGSLRSLARRVRGLNVMSEPPSDGVQLETSVIEPVLRKAPETSRKTVATRTQVA